MRAVVQRVSRAKVTVNEQISGQIGRGLLVLLGVGQGDTEADADYLAEKIAGLRIFEDAEGKMNRAVGRAAARCWRFRSSPCMGTCVAAGGRHLTGPPGRSRDAASTTILWRRFALPACAAKPAASRK